MPRKLRREENFSRGAAIFLASRAGDFVVGETLIADGDFARALPARGLPLRPA